MDNNDLHEAVLEKASEKINPAGEKYKSLSLAAAFELARRFKLAGRYIEIAALEAEVIPERYQRSMGCLGYEGQKKLLSSSVGLVGAGGLGGFVIELLARMGAGRLVVIDEDTFSDSNLNRQLLAVESALGKSKTGEAIRRAADINSSVQVEGHHCRGVHSNMVDIFKDCDLIIDCLDNLPSRFDLEKVCGELNLTMVHGAIAGFIGQVAVIRPERPLLSSIYGQVKESGAKQGVELQLGNPAFTPAMLASFQCSEAVKILAGLEGVLPEDRLLIIDMQTGTSYQVDVGGRAAKNDDG